MKPPPKTPRPPEPFDEVHVTFDLDEPATLERNARVILYQRLAACVDALTLPRATDLVVEVACLFADGSEAERDELMRHARAAVPVR